MNRAQTRSSSRMSNLSRATNVSTAKSSSRINNLLDDFDMRASTPIRIRTTNLLIPKRENQEYETLRQEIFHSMYKNKEDTAALKIQNTFRMYVIKNKMINIINSHKKARNKKIHLFFNLMMLNSTNPRIDRRKIFQEVITHAAYLRKFYRGYKPATNEVYAATGMMAVPPFIKGDTLIKFVYLAYGSRLRSLLEEWHAAACKSRLISKYSKNFKLDKMSMLRFGIYYRTFAIWLNFTRVQRNRKLSTIDIPQWNIFMKGRLRKQRQIQKASDFRRKTIGENAVQALRNVVLSHRHYKKFYDQSIQFDNKKTMKYALSAWIKYLILEQNKSVTMRFVFRRWLQSVQRRKHLIMLSKALTKRHEYYQKRLIVDILSKNRKVSQCLNMYQYLRIMQKPSLALYFVSILRKDIYSEAISHTFTAWIGLVRRRRRWLHFVFMNEVTSEYTPKKRVFLAALRHYASPTLTPICLYSGRFKKESMFMYQKVMNEKVDPSSIYLIVNGDTPDEVKKAASKSKTQNQQREIFFKIWLSQKKNDFSLFMRSTIVHCAKKASITLHETEAMPESVYKQYKKVISYLAGMNIASDSKFKVALQTVSENNKKNLQNRMSCLHRDNLIILAHDSHSDAIDLHDANNEFKNSDEFVKTKKIIEASEKLAKSFQPLVPIDKLGAILEQPNEDQFVFVDGCRSNFKSFKPTIIECHNIIHRELVRSEIGHDVASRFDKLLAGHDVSAAAKNGAHSNSRVDPYSRYKGDNPLPRSRPKTGINDKLSSKFPQRNRKARIIGKVTEKFTMSDLPPVNFNSDNKNEEEEEEADDNLMNDIYTDNMNQFDKSKSIASVFSKNENLLLNSLVSRSQERLIKLKLDKGNHSEEEDNELMQKLIKLKNQNGNDDSDVKFEIDQTLIDGFDKSTMLSLKQVKDVQSPRTAKKYKLFLEILFGRAGKEVNNVQVNKLRQRILSEFKNKKASFAACGINTKNISRPVSGILNEYRRKNDELDISSGRNKKDKNKDNKDKNNNDDNNNNNNNNNPDEEKNEYMQTYNSRRYKFKKKTENDDDEQSKLKDTNRNDSEIDSKREGEENKQKLSGSENEDDKQKNFNSSDSEFREDLNDDDNDKRDQKKPFNDDENDDEIDTGKDDENINDNEFDPAANHKENLEEEEEEIFEEEEEPNKKDGNGNENNNNNNSNASNNNNNNEGNITNNENNENDNINNNKNKEKKISTQRERRRRRSTRRMTTTTPYTSRNKTDLSALAKVDKIAIRLLNEQIPDESGYGLLVDIDPEQMPPLFLKRNESYKMTNNDDSLITGPSYRQRRKIKVTNKLHKRTVPIVIPNKAEMTPNMKLTLLESDNFDKLLYVNGKSQYIASKKKESNYYLPHYNKVVLTESPSVEFDNINKTKAFIENQVVSFQGGKRQQGTYSPNFMNVRIQQGKQRRGVNKPLSSLGIISNTFSSSSLASLNDQQQSTSNSNSNLIPDSKSDNRVISSHVSELTYKIVLALASNQEDAETFEVFYQRAKLTVKKKPSSALSSNLVAVNHQIYESLVEINYDYNKKRNLLFTANNLLALAAKYDVYPPVLIDAIEKAKRLSSLVKNKQKVPNLKLNNNDDDSFNPNYLNTSWMVDIPMDYDYNAVAVQYREDKLNDSQQDLDAIIASTNPSRKKSKRRPKTELLPDRKWDDVLKDYNIGDMMMVTPYVIPEPVVDDVLEEYRKTLKVQMH